jgi:hypothetical protein
MQQCREPGRVVADALLAMSLPSALTSATSWWSSAQSIPQNTLKISILHSVVVMMPLVASLAGHAAP